MVKLCNADTQQTIGITIEPSDTQEKGMSKWE